MSLNSVLHNVNDTFVFSQIVSKYPGTFSFMMFVKEKKTGETELGLKD